eukprot:TRINITY_DN941_c0_g1_i1.p1 TRINITY_DN941_c0_g1~~TRINITY_DN941_c0_g1_i1.p1  ORF type:complete len:322 (+),score=184.06 TRINITY_DN941_c0_g1_i1:50-967(+)
MAAALNPHKNPLRNLKKKVDSIAALKGKTDLDESQLEKLKMEKKILAEYTALEKKYNEWEAANNAPAAAPQKNEKKADQKKAPEPKKTEQKKAPEPKKADQKKAPEPAKPVVATAGLTTDQANKLRNLTKKLKSIEELEEKIGSGHEPDKAQKEKLATKKEIKKQIAELEKAAKAAAPKAEAAKPKEAKEVKEAPKEAPKKAAQKPAQKPAQKAAQKPAAKKAKEPAAAAAVEEPAAEPQMDAKTEKTIRNRLKNLNSKLESIAELKKSGEELTEEQVTKVKSEKKTKAEVDELKKKLAAFGLSA